MNVFHSSIERSHHLKILCREKIAVTMRSEYRSKQHPLSDYGDMILEPLEIVSTTAFRQNLPVVRTDLSAYNQFLDTIVHIPHFLLHQPRFDCLRLTLNDGIPTLAHYPGYRRIAFAWPSQASLSSQLERGIRYQSCWRSAAYHRVWPIGDCRRGRWRHGKIGPREIRPRSSPKAAKRSNKSIQPETICINCLVSHPPVSSQ